MDINNINLFYQGQIADSDNQNIGTNNNAGGLFKVISNDANQNNFYKSLGIEISSQGKKEQYAQELQQRMQEKAEAQKEKDEIQKKDSRHTREYVSVKIGF